MPIDRQNLMENLVCAWAKALGQRAHADKNKAGARNKARSKIWVDEVAARFRVNYPGPRERVFWGGNPDPKIRAEFKKKEMLFDIMVCAIDTVESFEHPPQPLAFIAQCHWQVESEFSDDTRDIVIDMGKLVAGSAAHKLMIAAHPKPPNKDKTEGADEIPALLNRCAKIAACCEGQHVYFCFVAHPQDWCSSSPKGPVLYEYTEEGWKELG